ncbi:MAG TPA: TaqI-like C-terminal specificity domain-containing protein [Chitinophagaceae bacterium]|nr:TaqI-like C-terminal specificity domain-containing protein [Chitinophagaceae bacterium]
MPLFQQSVVKKYLTDLDKETLQQRWNIFVSHFHNSAIQQNILNAKEEEYQEGFVRDLFVTVLGYTLNPQPDYNFVLEKKTEADCTKSDGAIVSSPTGGGREGAVVGVIELKDTTTTDLDKVEKQAFGYKHRHRDCTYVITANFQKLRFYINDAIEYEEFDLFSLTRERFDLLYLCLGEQNIFKNIPLLIKQASLTQEEAVTKKLYADYSGFRKKLFYNITELNPQYPKIELFKKTQKLLDRFLFILFAEDRMLVPANSVRKILQQWQQLKEMDAAQPLYQRFKLYFGYLNNGRQDKEEIFAYNGGLFATDEILDSIIIDDTILYESCFALSNYDFQTEIDVNILGHIFEHSLNELDQLDKGLQPLAAGRRKKDGVFYTPRYITKYIVANTVGALCEQKKLELNISEEVFAYRKQKDKKRERLVKLLDEYRNWLLQLTICDPACGSGAFLNQALEFLIAEHRHIDELKANLFGDAFVLTDLDNEILEKNLFGVDINEEAVEIARLSLWLRTAKKDRKLSSLTSHIQCGNSLIDDPAIAGDKAFNWQKAFPKIFPVKEKQPFHITFVTHYSRRNERMNKYRVPQKEGFWMNEEAELLITGYIKDVVIENNFKVLAYNICGDHIHMMIVAEETELPEIMRKIKGKTSQRFKEHLQVPKEEEFHLWAQKYNTTWLNTAEHYNNAIAYIENNRSKHELPINKGLQPLVQGMLTTEEAAYAVEYKGGFDVVIGNPPYVTGTILKNENDFIRKKYETAQYQLDLYILFIEKSLEIISKKGLISFITPNSWLKNMMMSACRKFLLDKTNLITIVPNMPEVFIDASVDSLIFIATPKLSVSIKTSITDFKNNEFVFKHNLNQEDFYKNDNLVFAVELDSGLQLLIEKIRNGAIEIGEILDVTRGINPYDIYTGQAKEIIETKAYHSTYKKDDTFVPELRGKHVSRYNYNWDGEHYISYGDWLAAPRNPKYFTGKRILFREILGENFVCTYIDEDFKIDRSLYIALHINDEYDCKYVLTILASKLLAFYFRYVNNEFDALFPKIRVAEFKKLPLKITNKQQQLPFIAKADIMLAKNKELQELKQQLLQLLQSNFPAVQLNKKLEQWPSLSFAEFLKELSKQKIKPALPQQAEWMGYFDQQKTQALALQTVIDTTDKEIDAMVYALYGLSAEEIKIVEGNA